MRSQDPAARAVVLARGLGTRMREADPGVSLTGEQQQAADAGLKALMPVNGRPFLDFVLSALADAGLPRIALVVAPDHERLRVHLAQAPPSRTRVDFVVQPEALGTANAVLAAEPWTGGEPFLTVNADNLYPPDALRALAGAGEPAMLAFDADDLVRTSNIPEDRIRAFAVVTVDERGYLRGIVEKPGAADAIGGRAPATSTLLDGHQRISMNCWRFDSRIFDACRGVAKSARGEFELPEAVALAISRGVRVKAIPARGPVLDLSRRADAADVARRLAGVVPCP
ncbi:MAG TPA: nucleotidyltransferase family protein [Vicinamibacterales bacterium]|nr:nucleotidyltransferase family protein [Vicinamibacterales bacterium]